MAGSISRSIAFGGHPVSAGRRVVFPLALLVILAALSTGHNQVLINTTPSEPEGIYWRVAAPVAVGQLVAFKAPAAAFPYADRRLGFIHRVPLLKAVAAGPGDTVCTADQRLVINGAYRASILVFDERGRALPQWSGCRPMAANEWFLFSNRVPRSFDSRYFGPVGREAILGVYAPLVTTANGGR